MHKNSNRYKKGPLNGRSEYYYIDMFLEIRRMSYLGDGFDDDMLAIGNCFIDKAKAEKAVPKIRKVLIASGGLTCEKNEKYEVDRTKN